MSRNRGVLTAQVVQGQLTHASATAVIQTLAQGWPNITNSIRRNPLIMGNSKKPFFKKAYRLGTPENDYLMEFMALGILSHHDDCWAYISGSSRALLTGDLWTAIHLAYYAELRAAASLLFSSGIGIINTHSFVVGTSGACQPIAYANGDPSEEGTHRACWPILEAWSGTSLANGLLDSIRVSGVGLNDICNHMGLSLLTGFSSLLNELGLDLQLISKDHHLRNKASYGPTGCTGIAANPRNSSALLSRAWESVEENQFVERLGVELVLRGKGKLSKKGQTKLLMDMQKSVTSLGGNANTSEVLRWQRHTNNRGLPETRIQPDVGTDKFYLGIWSRAFQMGLLASLAVRGFIQRAGITDPSVTLRPWWSSQGDRTGLLQKSGKIVLEDLLSDVAEQAKKSAQVARSKPKCHHQLWSLPEASGPYGIGVFGRVGLLGAYS